MAEREKESECVSFRDLHSEFIEYIFVLWLWTLYSSVCRSCNDTETNTLDNTIDSDHSSIALYAQLYMSCSTNQTFHRTPNMYNAIQAFQHFTAFFSSVFVFVVAAAFYACCVYSEKNKNEIEWMIWIQIVWFVPYSGLNSMYFYVRHSHLHVPPNWFCSKFYCDFASHSCLIIDSNPNRE